MPTLALTLTTTQDFALEADAYLHDWSITAPWANSGPGSVATLAAPGAWTLTVDSLGSAPAGGGLFLWTLDLTVAGPNWYCAPIPGAALAPQPLPWPYFGVSCNIYPTADAAGGALATRMSADDDGLVLAMEARGGLGGVYPKPSGVVTYTQDGMEIDWLYNATSTSGAPLAMVYWPKLDYALLAFNPELLGDGTPVYIGAAMPETLVDFRTHARYAIAIDSLGFVATSMAWAYGYMPSNPCELPNGLICQQIGNGKLPNICFDLPALGGNAEDIGFGMDFFCPPHSDARFFEIDGDFRRVVITRYGNDAGIRIGLRVTAAMRAAQSGRLWWLYQDCSKPLASWNWHLAFSDDGARDFTFPSTTPEPVVLSSLSPQQVIGPTQVWVTLTGSGFSNVNSLLLNGFPAPFRVVSDTELLFLTPAVAGTTLYWPGFFPLSDVIQVTTGPNGVVWGNNVRMCDLCITPDQGAVSVGVSYDQSTGLKQLLFKRCADPEGVWPSDADATVITVLSGASGWRIFQRVIANRAQLVATNARDMLFTSDDMGRTWNSVAVAIFDAPMVSCDMAPTADGGAMAAGLYVPSFSGPATGPYGELRIKRCEDSSLSAWPSEYASIENPAVGYSTTFAGYQMMDYRLLHRQMPGAGQTVLLPTYGYGCYVSSDFGRTWAPNG